MNNELFLDPQIRTWVFLPIVLITFFSGILKHFISQLIPISQKSSMLEIRKKQILKRSHLLRYNCNYIPEPAFQMRRSSLNPNTGGLLKIEETDTKPNIAADPTQIYDIFKSNLTNLVPTLILGGWIHYVFSGFILTKVPFPLSLKFKAMLQREIGLESLDASWVSSASWYVLNVFGLHSFYFLLLGQDNNASCEESVRNMKIISGGPVEEAEMKIVYKNEWEAVEIRKHKWELENVTSLILNGH